MITAALDIDRNEIQAKGGIASRKEEIFYLSKQTNRERHGEWRAQQGKGKKSCERQMGGGGGEASAVKGAVECQVE